MYTINHPVLSCYISHYIILFKILVVVVVVVGGGGGGGGGRDPGYPPSETLCHALFKSGVTD